MTKLPGRGAAASGTRDQPMASWTQAHWMIGRRCAKAFWLALHSPAPLDDEAGERQRCRFLRHVVQLFHPCVRVKGTDAEECLNLTRQLLHRRLPVVDATFRHAGWLARADLLLPSANDGWVLIGLSLATTTHPQALESLAYQAHVLQGAGLNLQQVRLIRLHPYYLRGLTLDAQRLIVSVDVTSEVASLARELPARLDDFASLARHDQAPEVPIGPHCETPDDCPFKAQCWAFLPEHNVFHLARLKREQAFELVQQGCLRLDGLPGYRMTAHRRIQQLALATQRPYLDRPALERFLARLRYPLHCLDFETVSAPIPWLKGTRPYTLIPVQFSLTHLTHPSADPAEEHFLCGDGEDPRPVILSRLQAALNDQGSILAYNAAFERMVLRGLCEGNRLAREWYASLANRWVDVMEPFKAFAWYHASLKGSASLKAVLPAVTGMGYEDLNIRNGDQATEAWLRLLFDAPPLEESRRLRQDLAAYCRRDTEGLLWIIRALEKLF